jgi:hypothetical protein
MIAKSCPARCTDGPARPIPPQPRLSHIVQIQTEVGDPAAVHAACRRLGLPEPVHGSAQLFSGEATGLLVKLPDWF